MISISQLNENEQMEIEGDIKEILHRLQCKRPSESMPC